MPSPIIHPLASVDPDAEIGAGTRVGPFAVVEAGVRVGENCSISCHAVLRSGTFLNHLVQVDAFAVIGGEPQFLGFDPGIKSGVCIESGVKIREGVTIHRSIYRQGMTRVSRDCVLMANSHLGHDSVLEERVVLANGVLLAGHVQIGADTFVGGAAVFHQHVRVGCGAMIGGNAGVGMDVAPYCTAAERNKLFGLNLVGLRRRKTSADALRELKELYRILLREPGAILRKAQECRDSGGFRTGEAVRFLDFFRESKRHYLRDAGARETTR